VLQLCALSAGHDVCLLYQQQADAFFSALFETVCTETENMRKIAFSAVR